LWASVGGEVFEDGDGERESFFTGGATGAPEAERFFGWAAEEEGGETSV
jgi:hypothetical protein